MSHRDLRREAVGATGDTPGWDRAGAGHEAARLLGRLGQFGAETTPSVRERAGGIGLLSYVQALLRAGQDDVGWQRAFVRGYLQGGTTYSAFTAHSAEVRLARRGSASTQSTRAAARFYSPGDYSTRASGRVPAFVPRRRSGAFGATSHYRYIGHVRRRR
jgi:hypothetical protein